MKRLSVIIYCIIISWSTSCYAAREQIHEIYTEANGNNRFEAKIKAVDKAMRRAFLILADKFLIDDENLKKITHLELRGVFSDFEFRDENIKIYPSGATYKGVIRFVFKQSKVNELIQKYASDNTKSKFFNALIIPIFKINNILYIDDNHKGWINSWKKVRTDLLENNLYYPQHNSDFSDQITPRNVMKLSYEDFADILPFKLFKQVIIPVAEYFTDKTNGDSFLKVKYIIISLDNTVKTEGVTYNLLDAKNNMNGLIDNVVRDFIQKFGNIRNVSYSNQKNFDLKVNDNSSSSKAISKENYYTFLIELNYDKEITEIQKKLNSLSEIKRFEIEAHSSLGYKVKVYSDESEEDFIEALYYHGLSFYFNEYQNPVLLNIKEAIDE